MFVFTITMILNVQQNNFYQKQVNFKALPTKVCGFCHKEDVGVVLGAAAYQKNPNLILGLLINLQHYALKGLSLSDKKAGELLRAIREGSFQRNVGLELLVLIMKLMQMPY